MAKTKFIEYEPKARKIFGEEKWVATLHSAGQVSLESICDLVANNTTNQPSEVRGLIRAYMQQIRFHLLNGDPVNIEGVGTFYPRLSTKLVATEEEVSVGNCVRSVSVGFRPANVLRDTVKASGLREYKKAKNAI